MSSAFATLVDAVLDEVELGLGGDERHHDLRHDRWPSVRPASSAASKIARACISTISGKLTSRREPRWPSIGLNSRKRRDAAPQAVGAHPHGGGDLGDGSLAMRQELVQRRIEQADGHRQAGHDLEQLDEVAALHGQELGERPPAPVLLVGEDHLAHGDDAVLVEEHMLGAAEPDAVGAEGARLARIGRRVGIGPHPHAAKLIGPAHQRDEVRRQLWLAHRHAALDDLPARRRRW